MKLGGLFSGCKPWSLMAKGHYGDAPSCPARWLWCYTVGGIRPCLSSAIHLPHWVQCLADLGVAEMKDELFDFISAWNGTEDPVLWFPISNLLPGIISQHLAFCSPILLLAKGRHMEEKHLFFSRLCGTSNLGNCPLFDFPLGKSHSKDCSLPQALFLSP